MPIMFRNIPDPKYIAKASKVPIATDKSKAVETEGRSFLSPIPSMAVHQLFQIENKIQYSGSFILCFIFFPNVSKGLNMACFEFQEKKF